MRAIEQMTRELPTDLAHRVFAPTEFAGNAAHRLARTRGPLAAAALRASAQLPLTWALIAGDPAKAAVLLCFLRGRRSAGSHADAFPHDDGPALGLVGAHLGAALRLRRVAQPSTDDPAGDPATEAVLSHLASCCTRQGRRPCPAPAPRSPRQCSPQRARAIISDSPRPTRHSASGPYFGMTRELLAGLVEVDFEPLDNKFACSLEVPTGFDGLETASSQAGALLDIAMSAVVGPVLARSDHA